MLFTSVVAKRKKPSKELLHHFTKKNVLLQDALGYSRICFEHFCRYNYHDIATSWVQSQIHVFKHTAVSGLCIP